MASGRSSSQLTFDGQICFIRNLSFIVIGVINTRVENCAAKPRNSIFFVVLAGSTSLRATVKVSSTVPSEFQNCDCASGIKFTFILCQLLSSVSFLAPSLRLSPESTKIVLEEPVNSYHSALVDAVKKRLST